MKKLLIIEDDADTRKLIIDLLERSGWEASGIIESEDIAGCGNHASEDIELIITDLSLPDSDYLDTVRTVRSTFPLVPIIVLTGRDELDLARKAIQEGAQDYLIKAEIDSRVLRKTIEYSKERHRLRMDYARLFTDSPAPMFIYDMETLRFLNVNDAALANYGYTREEFLSMTVIDIRPEEDVELFKARPMYNIGQYFDAGRWRHRRSNGEPFYVHIYAHRTEFGNRPAMAVLATDVTAKVQAQELLRAKSDEVQNILESITNGFFSVDREWRFTRVNSTFAKFMNMPAEDMIGRNGWDLFPEAMGLKFFNEYHRAVNERISVQFEEYYAPIDKWLSVNAYPTDNGLAVFMLDITERRRLQEQVQQERQNLLAIINNTTDIIYSVDRSYNIISANNAFWARLEHITGQRAEAIDETTLENDRLSKWQAFFDRAFNGEAFKVIWDETLADGSVRYDENSFTPIHNMEGEVIAVSCFSRDITEQRLYLNKIEEQNRRFQEIAWMQSHEVRSPVASILGLISILDEDMPAAEQTDVLRNIKVAACNLDTVIRKIISQSGHLGSA